MAALLLSAAGASLGSVFGPLGGAAGRIVGAFAGNAIDHALLRGTRDRQIEGPRLSDLEVMASTEGAPVPRLYGRVRISGQVIWATKLEEVISQRTETSGGKGGGPRTTTTTYSYFANFAVGLCDGRIGTVLRVWSDGKPLDLTGITMRVYQGTEDQTLDPLIVAKEGAEQAPAYRGLAYAVFERLPLQDFGNRIPQLMFEVVRPVGALEQMVRAVTLIPGTTEFGYDPAARVRVLGVGQSAPENRHVSYAASDVEASLDELQALCPALERVAIVVAWFGDNLSAATCRLKPGVETIAKQIHGAAWQVAGLDRAGAHVVSQVNGRPAYGGTPSDASVTHLIAEIKARGLKVTLYPFVVMDIPANNTLTDPWTGAAAQPAYPWRGRITCNPAPGRPGSPDGTPAAADQVALFFGATGPTDWTYRRMILHYAQLAAAAGGVDAFLIGSELRGLTRVRSGSGVYPVVGALVTLASDVKNILGAQTLVTYGADWTEYGAHVVDAAANEVRFPLDTLWASPAIGAIGIDYYAPLADWRDGTNHADRALALSPHDLDYLQQNLTQGEGFDWFYADPAAREGQIRAPITDGLGKPWVFRVKDFWSFWSKAHYERVGGIELASPTAWVARSKPIWLTEVGCPAVDKGANQPSIFPDPKSAEAGLPYFSHGGRDDLIQRRYLEAVLTAFDPQFGAGPLNPISPVYGGRMVEPNAVHLWTWDARPYPAFPAATDVWSDGANWETGHWLTGRLGSAPMQGLISAILTDSGVADFEAGTLGEGPDGYVIDRPMSPRAAIEPLSLAYAFDAAEISGTLAFRPRGAAPIAEFTDDDLVLPDRGGPVRLVRAQETELPREVSLGFIDGAAEYRHAAVTSRRLVGGAARASRADLAVVTNDTAAERRAEIWLQDLWAGRENCDFAVPPSRLALAPGDLVALTTNGRRRVVELREVVDQESRRVSARSIDPEIFELAVAPARRHKPATPPALGPVHVVLLDLPSLDASNPPILLRAAIFANPWPGPVAIWRSDDGTSFQNVGTAEAPAIMGETLNPLPLGPTSRWDRGHRLQVRLYGGALASVADNVLFAGANAAAVQRPDGVWEVLQFANAQLIAPFTYELSRLLRGQLGTEWAMGNPLPAGAPFVLLDAHVVTLARGLEALERSMQLRIVAAGRDHADPAAVALSATPHATALRPLSPVHLHARRDNAGVHLSWIRRTRQEGDAWLAGDVPLAEEREAYLIEVLSGATVIRSIEVTQPFALYAAADEFADFGAPQASLSIRVAQLSASVGRGLAAQAVLIV